MDEYFLYDNPKLLFLKSNIAEDNGGGRGRIQNHEGGPFLEIHIYKTFV
jgi:hypothetical protein